MPDFNGYRVEVQTGGHTIISEARFGELSDGATLLAQHLLSLRHGIGLGRLGALAPDCWAELTATIRPAFVELIDADDAEDPVSYRS